MAVFFKEGEVKTRPGVYQRHSNVGFNAIAGGARDGICAIPVKASWGPLGKVVKITNATELYKTYGKGEYGAGYTVPAAEAMFQGGATIVYTYRMGTGGTAGSVDIGTGLTATAKHVGQLALSVAVLAKLGDAARKTFQVYVGSELKESFDFDADATAEGANLMAAAKNSAYVTVGLKAGTTEAPATVELLAVASGALTGGADPTVTNNDYSTALAALEPYYYNCIALDVDDDESMTLSLLVQAYLDGAFKLGKQGIFVTGQKTSVAFADRCAHARAMDDEKVVFLGGGWMSGENSLDGVLSICRAAGIIASTPSNQGIVHTVITGATDVCEALTFAQYEDAIKSGMLMVSMSPEGSVWFDSGVNTLVRPSDDTMDDGWRKIRRVKVRFELFDRLDRELMPKVGKVSCDSDGVADIIQAAQRILDAMANNEGKLFPGAAIMEDPANPYNGDSAWFIIQADDIDSLEKIYLHYQFRYSQVQ